MLVLDANAAIAFAKGNPEMLGYRDLFEKDERVIAPDLISAEVTHAATKYVMGGHQEKEAALAMINKALSLVDELYPIKDMNTEAYNEALRLGHSTYDMYYFVLARRTGATVLTLDKKLNKLCIQNGVDCFYKARIENDPMGEGEWTVRVSNIDGSDVNIIED